MFTYLLSVVVCPVAVVPSPIAVRVGVAPGISRVKETYTSPVTSLAGT